MNNTHGTSYATACLLGDPAALTEDGREGEGVVGDDVVAAKR
jgi:hypothetical protein